MKISAKTDIGLKRQTNEDTFLIAKKDDNNFIAFVCDGMGGHLGGSYASSKTVEMLNEAYEKLDTNNPPKKLGVWLFETLQTINEFIYNHSLTNENLRGMGTTVSGVICLNGEFHYAHIGDSRIYVYNSNEKIEQITTDHTYVNTLLMHGYITPKQAAKHPKRHVLTNALGIKKDVSVDIGQIKLDANDNLLLCTDGVHNLLNEKKLIKLLISELDTDAKCDLIKDKVLELGGNDNLTLVLIER